MTPRVPEAVIFDLGGVLIDVESDRGLWPRILGTAPGRLDLGQLVRDPLFVRFGRGAIGPREVWREVVDRLGEDWDYDTFAARWCDIFRPKPDMDALFFEVAARVPVGLLSDTEPLHFPYLRARMATLQAIPRPTVSYEAGMLKPEPDFYRLAARNVGVPVANCFFVDDVQRNVDGARAVGMDAERFVDAPTLRAQLRERGLPLAPG
jgi:FMN phosphatase YigB (HAD superfamily)